MNDVDRATALRTPWKHCTPYTAATELCGPNLETSARNPLFNKRGTRWSFIYCRN